MRKILLICGALIVLIVAALVTLFFIFTNPNYLKAQVVEQIHAQTGLQAHINGKVSWILAPQLGIRFAAVELKQPLAFDPHSSASSQQVDVLVAWRPLLSGQVKIQTVALHQFSLSFRKDFSKNSMAVTVGGDLQLDFPAQRFTVDHLTVDSGDIHATGELSGQKISQRLELDGQLNIPQLNLTNIQGKLNKTRIHFHFAPGQGVSGQWASERLTIEHLNFSHITAKYTADMNKIQFTDIHSAFAGGAIKGQAAVTEWASSPQYQISAVLSHVELSQLLQSGVLQGPADLTAHLTLTGAALNGDVKLAAYDGVLNHIDLLKQIREVRHFLQANSGLDSAGATHFSQLTASGVINNSVFTNNDFILQSPDLQATGAGTVNLADEQVKYRLLVKAQGKLLNETYGVSVPLKIEGTLAKPKVKIDLGAMTISGKSQHHSFKINLRELLK